MNVAHCIILDSWAHRLLAPQASDIYYSSCHKQVREAQNLESSLYTNDR